MVTSSCTTANPSPVAVTVHVIDGRRRPNADMADQWSMRSSYAFTFSMFPFSGAQIDHEAPSLSRCVAAVSKHGVD